MKSAALPPVSAEKARVVNVSDGATLSTVALVVSAVVVIFTTLGMIHHALVSQALFGRATSNAWYFMTALPFLFVLLVRGLEAIHHRLAIVAPAALAVRRR